MPFELDDLSAIPILLHKGFAMAGSTQQIYETRGKSLVVLAPAV